MKKFLKKLIIPVITQHIYTEISIALLFITTDIHDIQVSEINIDQITRNIHYTYLLKESSTTYHVQSVEELDAIGPQFLVLPLTVKFNLYT